MQVSWTLPQIIIKKSGLHPSTAPVLYICMQVALCKPQPTVEMPASMYRHMAQVQMKMHAILLHALSSQLKASVCASRAAKFDRPAPRSTEAWTPQITPSYSFLMIHCTCEAITGFGMTTLLVFFPSQHASDFHGYERMRLRT